MDCFNDLALQTPKFSMSVWYTGGRHGRDPIDTTT
jgi:hypothetical protein